MADTTEAGGATSGGRGLSGLGASTLSRPEVQLALGLLPAVHRRLLLLVYEAGLSPAEAGARLGIAASAVDRVMAEALARLARFLHR